MADLESPNSTDLSSAITARGEPGGAAGPQIELPRRYSYHRPMGAILAIFLIPFVIPGLIMILSFAYRPADMSMILFTTIWWLFIGLFGATASRFLFGSMTTDSERLVTYWAGIATGYYWWADFDKWGVMRSDNESQRAILKRLYPEKDWSLFAQRLDSDDATGRAIIARVSGRRRELLITKHETWSPSFDEFVDDLRSRISSKEVC